MQPGLLWRRFRRQPWWQLSLTISSLFILTALLAPWLSPYSAYEMNPDRLLHPPSLDHWAGTDRFGRDIFSRLLHGSQIALQVAAFAVGLALIAGTFLGLIAGYFGGLLDWLISRLIDVLLSLPEILLALVAIAILGPSLMNLTLAIALVYTPLFARIARGAVLQIRQETYVEASQLLGAGPFYTMRRHILPNITGPIIVQTSLSLAFAILAEAALSFLGFGVEPDMPSWGVMLREGKDWLEEAWWMAVYPGLVLTAVAFSFHQLGDQFRQCLQLEK